MIPDALFDYRYYFTSTRLVSDRDDVERAVGLGLRCLEAFAENGEYETVLRQGVQSPVEPRAIVSIGRLELWAYQRPSVLRRLFSHARLDARPQTLVLLVWALWAQLHPASLRQASRMWGNLRDARAAGTVHDHRPYEWPLSRLARAPRADPEQLSAGVQPATVR